MNVANASFSQIPFHQRIVDEVAEPHVRELVRDRLGDVELLDVGGLRGIEQQQRLAVGDEPGVLHRALREVRDRRLVELLLRVRDRVVVAEPVQGVGADLVRVPGQVQPVGTAGDPDRRRPRERRLGEAQTPDHDTHEVGRHHDRAVEPHPRIPRVGRLAPDLGRVRQRGQVLGDDQGHLERRLEVGLVPAREVAARVGRLEVRGDDDVLAAGVVGEARAVHPLHQIAELAGELQAQGVRAGRELPAAARA